MYKLDLNSDLGESFGSWQMGDDAQVLTFVSSVNMACGFHAGDPMVMRDTLKKAAEAGTAVGAHPGYPDLVGFGRRAMICSPDEIYCDVLYQIGAIKGFCAAQSLPLQHVKAHGALYNQAAKDLSIALAIAHAVKDSGEDLILMGLAGSKFDEAAAQLGLAYAPEAFADRGYRSDGSLVPRSMEGAFIQDPETAARRVITMIKEGFVETIDGSTIEIHPASICLHGDSPQAVAMARTLRQRLLEAEIKICPLREVLK